MRRVHGLKSGKMLKEFVGHTSYVNDVVYSPDGSQIISAASDSTVRVWDAKSCEELRAFKCAVLFSPHNRMCAWDALSVCCGLCVSCGR